MRHVDVRALSLAALAFPLVSSWALAAANCVVTPEYFGPRPEETRVGRPMAVGASGTKSQLIGLGSAGGSTAPLSAEDILRQKVHQSIWDRDVGEFVRLMPSDPKERADLLRRTNALYWASNSAAVGIVRQMLAWEPGAMRALDEKSVASALLGLARSWYSVRESERNKWPVKNPPSDSDYVELFRLLLDTGIRLDGPPQPTLGVVLSIPFNAETNRVAGWLLDRGASIERAATYEASAFARAAAQHNEEMFARMMRERTPSQDALDEALVRSRWREPTHILERLLAAGADINQDGSRFSARFEPAQEASIAFRFYGERGPLLLALQYRADPNRQMSPVNSALMNVMHDLELMEGLLALGANPNYATSNGETALGMAIRTPAFVEKSPTDTRSLSEIAPGTDPVRRGQTVALLLRFGADPNLAVNHDFTPIMNTRATDGPAIEALLDRGAKIVVPPRLTEMYRSKGAPLGPVSWSITQHNETLAAALLRRGARAEGDDCGALYYALAGGQFVPARLLVQAKANRRFQGRAGEEQRLLIVAAAGGSVEAVRLVLDHKLARIDETLPSRPMAALGLYAGILVGLPVGLGETGGGENALMVAAQGGHLEVVKELLDRGIDVKHRNGTGGNALSYARFENREAIAGLLRARGLK